MAMTVSPPAQWRSETRGVRQEMRHHDLGLLTGK
jgi:hypothetical protein